MIAIDGGGGRVVLCSSGAEVLQIILQAKVDLSAPAYGNVIATAVQENRAENVAMLVTAFAAIGEWVVCLCLARGRSVPNEMCVCVCVCVLSLIHI